MHNLIVGSRSSFQGIKQNLENVNFGVRKTDDFFIMNFFIATRHNLSNRNQFKLKRLRMSERDVLLHSSSNVLLREDQRIDLLISHSWDHTFNADVILIAADAHPSSKYPSPKRCSNAKLRDGRIHFL